MKTRKVLRKILALSTGAAMLGATLTGALALDTTLANYPSQFIDSNGVFSGLIVVGAGASASDSIGQSIILNDLATKAVTRGNTRTSISGDGKSEEIVLGDKLSSQFDTLITDTDVKSMQDTTIRFDSSDYDVQEILAIDGDTVETSLTASEDDYQKDVYLEVARDSIKYFYAFDEAIKLKDKVSVENPLEIKFLGKDVKITGVSSNNKITARLGTEYFMNVDDSVLVDGKKVTLLNVGSNDAVVVEVDGVSQTINNKGTRNINGIEVGVDDTFVSDTKAERSATLVIGTDVSETITDSDSYIGQSEDNPNWVWNLENLYSDTAVATSIDSVNSYTGPIIGIENDFVYNDFSDNPTTVGECIDLPNNYLSICFDSLTTDKTEEYTLEYDSSADLVPFGDGKKVINLHSNNDEGFVVNNGQRTKDIYLEVNKSNPSLLDTYYKYDGDIKLDLSQDISSNKKIAEVSFENTKGSDLRLYAQNQSDGDIELSLVPNAFADDTLTSVWKVSGGNIVSLGASSDTDESDELLWGAKTIGNKDSDLRTRYGIIVKNPNSEGSSERISVLIPNDQVKAEFSIGGTDVNKTVTTGTSITKINPIPSSVAVLDSEVTSATAQNLIVVGGPAVNKLAESVFGLTAANFTPNEAMIKLVANGEKAALLVAGYEAVDTRNAATAVANGKLVGKTKADAVVKSTQLNEYTVE